MKYKQIASFRICDRIIFIGEDSFHTGKVEGVYNSFTIIRWDLHNRYNGEDEFIAFPDDHDFWNRVSKVCY